MRGQWLWVVVVLIGVFWLAWRRWGPSQTTESVAMRDGTRLATDVYLPAGRGPWPVLLVRTPYERRSWGQSFRRVTLAGYALVAQSTRGRFGSQGEDIPFHPDGWGAQRDGEDTVEWIAGQPWCDGSIGTLGPSAMGITQYALAGTGTRRVACQHILVGTPNLYEHALFPGGVFRQALVLNWLRDNGFSEQAHQVYLSHPEYDDFWRGVDLSRRWEEAHAPALHVGGWYDIFSQGTLDAFMGLQHRGGEGARGNQWLLMGPWPHGAAREVGELVYPPNALQAGPLMQNPLIWYDHWLKGGETDLERIPRVTYYVMGDVDDPDAPGNQWRHADDWPPPAAVTRFHLRAGGRLTREAPAEERALSTYRYDPADPVPTLGGNNLTLPAGPFDQRPVEARPDVLVFSSDPLEEPLEVTGRVTARLWVSSSAPDTDFMAKLSDVYPDGRSMLVLDGAVRARYRNSRARAELLEPGQVVEVEIDLWSTSLIFNRGHRVRLAVSSSNAPRFQPNPNTGEPFNVEPARVQPADNTVYFDRERPSSLLLPVRGE